MARRKQRASGPAAERRSASRSAPTAPTGHSTPAAPLLQTDRRSCRAACPRCAPASSPARIADSAPRDPQRTPLHRGTPPRRSSFGWRRPVRGLAAATPAIPPAPRPLARGPSQTEEQGSHLCSQHFGARIVECKDVTPNHDEGRGWVAPVGSRPRRARRAAKSPRLVGRPAVKPSRIRNLPRHPFQHSADG